MIRLARLRSIALVGCLFLSLVSCGRSDSPQITLYTSVDDPYARPLVEEFQKQTGITVRLVTDAEASKSVGLAERLRAEKDHPQCDVWWGNEPFYAINLAEEGLLEAYDSPSAADVQAMFRDPQHRWAGNGLRARVFATADNSPAKGIAASIDSLSLPALKGKIAIARPTAGTTGGHVAAIYVSRGQAKADVFFQSLHDNDIKLLGGNGPVAEAIGAGTAWAGLTDNDDCFATQREGGKLSMALPDQSDSGTLMIPTTVALVRGTQNPDASKKLIDFLLSARVEQKMIDAKFVGWSVRGASQVKAMEVDYREVARRMPVAIRRATAILEGRDLSTIPTTSD